MKLKGKIIIGAMVLAAISGMQSMAAEKEVYQLGEVLVTANNTVFRIWKFRRQRKLFQGSRSKIWAPRV